jgi:hypothetical protein
MPEGVSNYAVAEKKSAFAFGRLRAKPTAAEPALGFLSPVTAAAPMPAQTPVSGSKGKVRSRGLDVSDELSAAKEKDKATEATRKSAPERRACTAVLSVHRNEHLTARSQGCRMHDSVRLRLVVDASGTVTHVIVVSGNQTLGALLGRKLTGASSATRSDGQASGSIELTVALSF